MNIYSGLPQTKLGTYLENRVNSFLKRKDAGAGDVTIRVLSSSEKSVEVRPGMKARFCTPGLDGKAEMADNFPYLAKAVFAFEEIDGIDVCFFGMHVQEFGSNSPAPNSRYSSFHKDTLSHKFDWSNDDVACDIIRPIVYEYFRRSYG